MRRHGREAEGDGLLNRYTGYTCIEGSNPSVSAIISYFTKRNQYIAIDDKKCKVGGAGR